jgi:hypothetical protein
MSLLSAGLKAQNEIIDVSETKNEAELAYT